KTSRIEPTAWALLALAESTVEPIDPDWAAFARPHLRFLSACQRPNGLLIERDPPNFTANGIAACVLIHLSSNRPNTELASLLQGLVAAKGVSVDVADPRQNNALRAWSWVPETFSWVEPTAYCVLALKRARLLGGTSVAGSEARIEEADRLLIN